MNLTEKFTFGKHKGERLDQVIDTDPTYIEWCMDSIKDFKISDRAHEQLHSSLEAHHEGLYRGMDLEWFDLLGY